MRHHHWLATVAIATAMAIATPAIAQNKPNIILILSDDFGYGPESP